MPELPEVETVKNSLNDLIIGKVIKSVVVNYPRIIQNVNISEFIDSLVGEEIKEVKRVGKYLVFILSNKIMLSHLRMEGKYFLKDNVNDATKHDHILFNFTDNTTLMYNDTRKFGVIYLFNTNDFEYVKTIEPLSKLGIEPISGFLTTEYLKEKVGKLHKPVKEVLLDQTIISGLGNIYADEVLFMAKIHPEKESCTLTDLDYNNIIESSTIVLNKAIALGGTTIKSFMSSHAITGRFQNELLVHTKEECPVCKTKILKIRVGGRGTYFCPTCQKL